MRAGPAEIRWHSTQPIYSVDFQAVPADEYKKQFNPYERAAKTDEADQSLWRLATAGGDAQVRLWLVTPTPNSIASTKSAPGAGKGPDPAKVEYLTTLTKHNGVVNCVRFAPFGSTLASAGDDGTVILWVPGEKPSDKSFGNDMEDELTYAREFWKVKRIIRYTQQEVYDLAWSPDGEMLIAGSTDNTARVIRVSDGTCIQQITDHSNYVQGVAWDPLNQFVATQSSDRHMHVYGVKPTAHNGISVSLIGKNTKLEVKRRADSPAETRQGRSPSAPSLAQPKPTPAQPVASTSMAASGSGMGTNGHGEFTRPAPPRRSASRASDSDRSEADAVRMDPPAPGSSASAGRPSSRRSSFSGSPVQSMANRIARSPSPVPPLPAIRTPLDHPVALPPAAAASTSSPAPTPASASLQPLASRSINLYGGQDTSPFFRRLAWSTDGSLLLTPAGLFADPFATAGDAQPPKKRKRPSDGADAETATPAVSKSTSNEGKSSAEPPKPTVYIHTRAGVASGPVAHLPGHKTGAIAIRFNPILFSMRTPSPSMTSPPRVTLQPGSVTVVKLPASEATSEAEVGGAFKLPHRMVYAVATHDAVLIYDTQQSTPLCYFGNLHYAPFTDLAWTPDGQTLVLASQDGYCSLAAFGQGELGTPLPEGQQIKRQPKAPASEAAPATADAIAAPPFTDAVTLPTVDEAAEGEPTSKKRRVALTFQGPIA